MTNDKRQYMFDGSVYDIVYTNVAEAYVEGNVVCLPIDVKDPAAVIQLLLTQKVGRGK